MQHLTTKRDIIMKIKFFQLEKDHETRRNFELPFEIGNEKESEKDTYIIGTTLRQLFDWCDAQRAVNSKGFKFSLPIHIEIETEKLFLDTTMHMALSTKLKLQKTNKSKRIFAQRFKAIYQYMNRDLNVVSYEDILRMIED